VLGGVFAQHLHWSMIFWINLPIGVGSLMLLLPRLRKVPDFHRHRKLDWTGGLLLMISAVVFLLALTWGGHKFAWLSPTILGMIGSAVVLMAAFVIHARTTEEPFLPLPLISGPVVPFSMVAGGSAMGTMIAMIVHLPIYYEAVYRLSASEAGIALIPLVAVSVLGAWSAGQFMAVTGRYKWVAFGGASVAASCLMLMAYLAAPPLWVLLSLLAVLALGIGTSLPLSVVSIQNAVPRSQVGTATGAMNFFRSLMSSFAVAVFTAILLAAIGQDIPIGEGAGGGHNIPSADMIIGFRFVFLTAALLMVMAATLFALMEERPLAGGKPSPAATMAE
jgi:MFS family permease